VFAQENILLTCQLGYYNSEAIQSQGKFLFFLIFSLFGADNTQKGKEMPQ